MSRDPQPQDQVDEPRPEAIEVMLDYTTANALLDMVPSDPKIDADAEAKLIAMDDKTMNYLITYDPALVWILDNFELRRAGPPSINLSSFMNKPCQDPHWMRPEVFEAKLSSCRKYSNVDDASNWPHKLIWGQWLGVARSRGHHQSK